MPLLQELLCSLPGSASRVVHLSLYESDDSFFILNVIEERLEGLYDTSERDISALTRLVFGVLNIQHLPRNSLSKVRLGRGNLGCSCYCVRRRDENWTRNGLKLAPFGRAFRL